MRTLAPKRPFHRRRRRDGRAPGRVRLASHRELYASRAIALTGYGMTPTSPRGKENGFTEHLTKPVDLAKLQSVIRRVTAVPVKPPD